MRAEFLCISVLRVAWGPRLKLASCKKCFTHPVVYWPFLDGGPGVSLTLCCFVVYSMRRFVLCLTLCHFVLVFFSPFSIVITSLGEDRANLSAFSYVCSICACLDLSVCSSSWCLGKAAVCDCGTPWTFLLPFLQSWSIFQILLIPAGKFAKFCYDELYANMYRYIFLATQI